MRPLKYITYLFYSYYSKGPRRNVAYLSAILGVTFFIYLTIMIVVAVFRLDDYIPIAVNESRGSRYLKVALFMAPVFFLLYFGIKEKRLEDLKERLGYDHYEKEFSHRVLLFLYLFLAFATLMTIAVLRK